MIRILLPCLLLLLTRAPSLADQSTSSKFWVTAYYPVWEQRSNLPADQIDYSAFTHLVQFSIEPTPTGDIDQTSWNAVTPELSKALVGRAHAAGDKVLIGVGGMGSGPALSLAIAPGLEPKFVSSLTSFVVGRGYDGIDIDMEPIADSDIANYEKFIRDLRSSLTAVNPNLLLTAAAPPAASPDQAMFAVIQTNFDQINVMSYDLSGPWRGFKSWYNSSLYGDGATLLTSAVPYPSVTGTVQRYLDAGIPASKLGIGIPYYGYIWTGASAPSQDIQHVTVQPIGYNAIMDRYYSPNVYHWDNTAHAPYLSIPAANPSQSEFISYDDARLCTEKVRYAINHHFGGVILFELGQGYRPAQPKSERDVLLQAVKRAWKVTGKATVNNQH